MTTILAVLFVLTLILLLTQRQMSSEALAASEREHRALLDEIEDLRDVIAVERRSRGLAADEHAAEISRIRRLGVGHRKVDEEKLATVEPRPCCSTLLPPSG